MSLPMSASDREEQNGGHSLGACRGRTTGQVRKLKLCNNLTGSCRHLSQNILKESILFKGIFFSKEQLQFSLIK